MPPCTNVCRERRGSRPIGAIPSASRPRQLCPAVFFGGEDRGHQPPGRHERARVGTGAGGSFLGLSSLIAVTPKRNELTSGAPLGLTPWSSPEGLEAGEPYVPVELDREDPPAGRQRCALRVDLQARRGRPTRLHPMKHRSAAILVVLLGCGDGSMGTDGSLDGGRPDAMRPDTGAGGGGGQGTACGSSGRMTTCQNDPVAAPAASDLPSFDWSFEPCPPPSTDATPWDFDRLSPEDRRVCRNLPFAHHGYPFKDAALRRRFYQEPVPVRETPPESPLADRSPRPADKGTLRFRRFFPAADFAVSRLSAEERAYVRQARKGPRSELEKLLEPDE